MKIRPSTGILLVIVIMLNLFTSMYVSQSILTRSAQLSDATIEELRSEVASLTAWVQYLTRFVEYKHGGTIVPDPEAVAGLRNELFSREMVVIGAIPATSRGYSDYVPYINEIIEPALNALAWELGSDIEFTFDIRDAQGQAAIHLEEVQKLNSLGVNLILGGMWSSHACASLSYCNDNDIILFSPSSTSPLKAIDGDNLFRLAPTDFKQGPVITNMILSKGVEALVVIYRGDAWADGIYNSFEEEFTSRGGILVKKMRYPGESTEFRKYLEDAESAALQAVEEFGWDKVGVELISFSESTNLIGQAKDYPTLYNLTWFGSDGTTKSQQMIDDIPEEVEHVKLYSPLPVVPETEEYTRISSKYEEITGYPLGYYDACSYDIAMIFGKAVIEAGTADVDVLKEKIIEVCEDYQGITGLCRLDPADDRDVSNYGIYSYSFKDGELGCWEVGMFSDTGEITWYED
jgi:branched-chain amino acid transport system substrate-binding protein